MISRHPDQDPVELYYLPDDFCQANDLSATHPENVEELQQLFWEEAEKYQIKPLLAGFSPFFGILPPLGGQTTVTYYGNVQNIAPGAVPRIYNHSYTISADLHIPDGGAEGVIVADANHLGGFTLYVEDGKLKHTYAFLGVFEYHQESTEKLPTGEVNVELVFAADEPKPATPGQVTLFINGKAVGGGRMDHTVPFGFSGYSGMGIGSDDGLVVDRNYLDKAPFAFTGTVKKVVFRRRPPPLHRGRTRPPRTRTTGRHRPRNERLNRQHWTPSTGALMTTSTVPSHSSVEDRQAIGERAHENAPLSAQADWEPAAGPPDPVELLIEQNATREPDLVPVRHGRMTVSPFTFYRGAAKVMATDLATTPMAGLVVQLCGDAHLSNFGGFASPERELLFGLNDFDETLPGLFEYDLKRMAASFTIAARNNGFTSADAQAVTVESVKSYRSGMAEFATMRTLDIWYAQMSEADIQDAVRAVQEASLADAKPGKGKTGKKKHGGSKAGKADAAAVAEAVKRMNKTLRKAHTRDSLGALPRFAEVVDGRHRIVSQPPVIIPLRDLAASYEMTPEQALDAVEEQFRVYKATLSNDRRQLLDRFTIVDMARKVVGVGSVGTRAFMVLLQGRDNADPLFLQVKEATASVLEDHLPKSRYNTPARGWWKASG
jgi:hypothetical protein